MNERADPTELRSAATPQRIAQGYMPGFGNDFETEALPGALPQGMNSPQRCAYGLYGEQLSGSAFTAPSHRNERTWCYRIRPSVKHVGRFRRIELPYWRSAPLIDPAIVSLGQYRWDPVPHAKEPLTWMTGMRSMTTAGDVATQTGMAAHIYLVTASMVDEYFYSADGELLVVPQEGRLRFCTELGIIDLEPQEIAILPRGLVYRVEVLDGPARGFVCENYGQTIRPAEPRADRSELLGEPPRLQDAGGGLRGPRARRPSSRSNGAASSTAPRSAIRRSTWWPGTATTHP